MTLKEARQEIKQLRQQVAGLSFAKARFAPRHSKGGKCICDSLCAILDSSRFVKREWGGYISVLAGMTLEYNAQKDEIERLQKLVTAQAEEG